MPLDYRSYARRVSSSLRELLSQPARRRQLAATAGGLAALAGAFQLGQIRAGYNAVEATVAERRFTSQVAQLQAENRQAAEQLARLQTDEQINREAYKRVEQQLAELQGKLIEQQEEVAFYRGMVGGNTRGSLQIQDFMLSPGEPGDVRLRFVLAQAERADRDVRGQLQVRVEGLRAGRLISLDISSMARGEATVPRAFDFRYFQELTATLRVPPDFEPERVVIRIVPATGGMKASVESFPWAVRGG